MTLCPQLQGKDENFYHPPAAVSNPVSYSDTEFAEGFYQFPGLAALESEINSKELFPETCKDDTHRKIGAPENILDNSLTYQKGSSFVIASGSGMKQPFQHMNEFKKVRILLFFILITSVFSA